MMKALKKYPFVSIIIPAYNEEIYLEKCLLSLKHIDYKLDAYEVIVVDNGSTDSTCEIAKKYNAQLVSFPEGTTISAVRNRGAMCAEGTILAFLDADCVVTKKWLLNGVNLLNSSVGVVGSRPLAPKKEATWLQKARAKVLSRASNVPVSWLSSSNYIVKKELFDQIGGFDEDLETCEDADISFKLNKITTILYSPYVKAYHLREPKNLFEFFKKEVWHGKSVYEGVIRHGLKKEELLSIFVPAIYLINNVIGVCSLVFNSTSFFTISFSVFWGLPLLATIKTLFRVKTISQFPFFYIIDFIYLQARSSAVLHAIKYTIIR